MESWSLVLFEHSKTFIWVVKSVRSASWQQWLHIPPQNLAEVFPLSEDVGFYPPQIAVSSLEEPLRSLIDAHLTYQQKCGLLQLRESYRNSFGCHLGSEGLATNIKHSVDTEGHLAIRQRPYRALSMKGRLFKSKWMRC